MTSINAKLGLKPAGKRAMMKLPPNRADAAALTAAQCPLCQASGVRACTIKGQRTRFCPRCGHTWRAED